MWQACRVAALQRLARSATSVPSIGSASASSSALLRAVGSNAHALRLDPRATAAAGAGVGQRHWALAQFSSSARPSREQPLTFHGIALVDLAKRSRRDLEDEFGTDKLRRARQALPQTWDGLLLKQQQEDEYEEHDESDEINNEPPVSRDVAKQIFMAALKQQLPQLALSVFEYMDAAFPTQVDFVVYGEVFTLLSRAGKTDETLAVFERNKPLYSDDRSAPELIYRFGVFGKLGKKDFAGVEELLDEMESFGIELSNELKSRIMIAYAKNGDSDKVLEIYESLDPQVGRWHEADVDRVINSMGLIHYADEAFEFYRNAQIKLTGNTILALLNVCRENDRPKHAMAILANRKRFNLVLNTREYNKVLETLEQFEEHNEIRVILDEMTQNGVRFDKLTKMIIARNKQHLQGTAYDSGSSYHQSSSPATSATAGFVSGREQQSDANEYEDGDLKLSEQESRRKMQEFNASKAFAMAAGLADMHVTPQASHGDEDDKVNNRAITISPFLAAEAVAAYANSGEHAKVKALLKGFATVKGDFGHALTYIISFYSKKGDHAMVYNAFKAVQFQGRDIYRVKEALERFLEFKDPEATMTLFHQAFQQIAVALEENGNDFAKLKKQLSFDRANLVKMTLQVLIENQQLNDVVEVLDTLEARGFHVRTSDYTTIFRLMREQQSQHPTNKVADEFETLWDDMVSRGVSPSKAILAHSCVALAFGSKAQQQRLLDAYAQVQGLQDDSYNIPPVCYSALLSATANLSDLSAVQKLFDEALFSLQEAKKSNPKIRFFPRNWVSTLVAKLAASEEESQDANATADHVFQHVKKMKKHCGGYAYDALLTALRVCAIANKRDQVVQLRAFFADAKCRLSLGDAEQLVRVAKEKNSFALAMLAIELFEEGNVVVSASKAVKTPEVVAPEVSETLKVSETESSPQTPAVKPFQMQKKPSAPVLKKIRDMYDVALSLSEQQQRANDIATVFLTARKAELAAMK